MIKKRTKNHDIDGFVCPAPEKMPVAGAQEGMWPPRKALILRPARCYLYYITTGQWVHDEHLIGRRNGVVSDINGLKIFEQVDMTCVGASELHAIYRKTKAPVTRQFLFDGRVEIPATVGVIQSLIGYLPFTEFKKLLVDDSGAEMLTSIFEDNIRPRQG